MIALAFCPLQWRLFFSYLALNILLCAHKEKELSPLIYMSYIYHPKHAQMDLKTASFHIHGYARWSLLVHKNGQV